VRARVADVVGMEISGQLSLIMQANSLQAVRSTMAAAQAAPPTPQGNADTILQLSTAAQQLLQGAASHPTP
jgi:hypothetical protein